MARRILVIFVMVCLAHLVGLTLGVTWLAGTTKAALMPALAAWVWSRGGARLIVAALLLSACGDIALEFDRLFIVGMGFFAAAHVCYATFFVRGGALRSLRRRWFIVAGYAVVWLALIITLWPGLGDLRLPVAVYSLLLATTAVTSAGHGPRAGLGGALFFCSDALIATDLAGLAQPPQRALWVMTTYVVGQYLLASGTMPSVAARRGTR